MTDAIYKESVSKLLSFNGIDVWNIETDKFKTDSINIFFHDNLSSEDVSYNALLPAVLRRGSSKYPTFKDIALALENMYGAIFDCGVTKKGEQQIVQFYIEFIKDRYTSDKEKGSLYRKALELVCGIITEPVLEQGIFKKDYTVLEKENMRKKIEGRVNDKMQYALDRCIEHMCKEEPFSIYDYGTVEGLEGIDAQGLYSFYEKLAGTFPIRVFTTGDLSEKDIEYTRQVFGKIGRKDIKPVGTGEINVDVKDVKNITEEMEVNQSKLTLGFRTYTHPSQENYFDLLVCNGILGGGMHSKLFQNVREKESLAYYIFSRLEKFKGIMLVSGGIDAKNADRTVEIIQKQLDDIAKGNITDYEFDSTIKTLETGINSLKDSQMQLLDFYLSQDITGGKDTLDMMINRIKNVKKEGVVEAARRLKLDTVYLLKERM
jgi:predicted Zn-dependent peptidase